MCGIAGRVGWSDERDCADVLGGSLDRLRHRGPDDVGVERFRIGDQTVDLGHTRLSVIDLSAAGHQPMSSADGRLTLVFNGEIYNYRELRSELISRGRDFRSDSDTEVLLQAWAEWGPACLSRMVGMWAFAILDRESRTLTCARDAFGIKPLFMATMGDGLAFASEIPALRLLLGGSPRLNHQRMYEYLVFGMYDVGDDTFLDGIVPLPPGSFCVVDLRKPGASMDPRRWWTPSVGERSATSEQAAEELRDIFLRSVRLHLRSDVPVGAALSGGIDSSAVVGAIRYLEPDWDIDVFSYLERGHPRNEEVWVERVAAFTGARVHPVHLTSQDLADDLDQMIRAQGEPFGDTSIFAQYRVFQRVREVGITVTLDGQGADELLAGYVRYGGARLASLIGTHHPIAAARFVQSWTKWPGRSRRSLLRDGSAILLPGAIRRAVSRAHSLPRAVPDWIDREACQDLGVDQSFPLRVNESRVTGRRMAQRLRHDLTQGRLQALLRHGDRNSMAWSVESRVPFLTTEMAEFCLATPEEHLVSPSGRTKDIFRRAMSGIVPPEILDRRDKIGFETPEREWLHQLGPVLPDWLEGLAAIPLVDPERARRVVLAVSTGEAPFSPLAWRLINAARWVQVIP